MTASFVLGWSVLRTVLAATLAIVIGRFLLNWARRCDSTRWRPVWLAGLVVPLLVPELLVGFTYRLTAQQLTASPWGAELLYFLLLLIRGIAVCVLVLLLLPRSAVTSESLHSWTLLAGGGRRHWRNLLKLQLTGPWRSSIVAWCLTALVTFQDFETAALIQVDSHPVVWTVWLFDAVAGNQTLGQSLRRIVAPVLFEILLLVPGLLLIVRQNESAEPLRTQMTGPDDRDPGRSRIMRAVAVLVTLSALAAVIGRPLWVSLPELPGGLAFLWRDVPGVLKQQLSTFGFSAVAAAIALSTAVLLRRWNRPGAVCCCLLPGLAGSLVLSLILLWLFQRPLLVPLWDTWLPLLLGQSLLLLPRAWVLLLILELTVAPQSLHSAQLLLSGNRRQRQTGLRLLWILSRLRWLIVAAVLCHWATWDVTTASILRPVSVDPVATRLYQEMHFSRTESLTALSAVTLLFPFAVAAAAVGASRWMLQRHRSQRVATDS